MNAVKHFFLLLLTILCVNIMDLFFKKPMLLNGIKKEKWYPTFIAIVFFIGWEIYNLIS